MEIASIVPVCDPSCHDDYASDDISDDDDTDATSSEDEADENESEAGPEVVAIATNEGQGQIEPQIEDDDLIWNSMSGKCKTGKQVNHAQIVRPMLCFKLISSFHSISC